MGYFLNIMPTHFSLLNVVGRQNLHAAQIVITNFFYTFFSLT